MASRVLCRRLTTDETLKLSRLFESGSGCFTFFSWKYLSSVIHLWQHHQQSIILHETFYKWRVKFWQMLTYLLAKVFSHHYMVHKLHLVDNTATFILVPLAYLIKGCVLESLCYKLLVVTHAVRISGIICFALFLWNSKRSLGPFKSLSSWYPLTSL